MSCLPGTSFSPPFVLYRLMSKLILEGPKLKDSSALLSLLSKAGLKSLQQRILDGDYEDTTVTQWIPTGIVPLDEILGGGFPAGRYTEISGPEASFKSGLAQLVAECAMLMGGMAYYWDNEETYDRTKARLHTYDAYYTDTIPQLEDFYTAAKDVLNKVAESPDALCVAVQDSLAATIPGMILKADEGARTIGEAARIHAMEIPQIINPIRKSLCAFIAINQIRMNMNRINKYDDLYQTPGGFAIKFYASLRLRLLPGKKFHWYNDSNDVNGIYINATTIKNKVNAPFQKASFPIIYQDNRGGDPAIAFWDWAAEADLIRHSNAGLWDCSQLGIEKKIPIINWHHHYVEHLDRFLDLYTEKTGFKYGDLARLAVKEVTRRIYAKTTEVVRPNAAKKKK